MCEGKIKAFIYHSFYNKSTKRYAELVSVTLINEYSNKNDQKFQHNKTILLPIYTDHALFVANRHKRLLHYYYIEIFNVA